jgi:carbamate kinase
MSKKLDIGGKILKQDQSSRSLKSTSIKKKVVVAIGGNAILQAGESGSFEEQFANISKITGKVVSIISAAERFEIIALTHGNGPQVGNMAVQQDATASKIPPQPMHSLIAMTQGQIGYMLQQAIQNELKTRGINKMVISIITQTLVDKNDPEFSKDKPSKPIGPFYTLEEAQELSKSNNYTVAKVKPTGDRIWRRVVPSPQPLKIIETEAVKKLINDGFLVIASGGGGIPVIQNGKGLEGVDGVLDKDLVAGLLGKSIRASILLILTDIDQVKLNFGKPNESCISKMTLEEAKRYMGEGQFLDGSMRPKIKSSIDFLEAGGESAIITSIDKAVDGLNEYAGTRIVAR